MDGVSVVAFVNTVGGQDELVFDGNSRIFGPRRRLLALRQAFEEDLVARRHRSSTQVSAPASKTREAARCRSARMPPSRFRS